MYRELREEVGLNPAQVEILGATRTWLRYRLPERFIRKHCNPLCIGQKQRWFMLRVLCSESDFCLDWSEKPEFDHWRWVRYWYPADRVVYFKRGVYSRALSRREIRLLARVPEPTSLALLGVGLAALWRRRKRSPSPRT